MDVLSTTTFDHYVANSSLVAGEPGQCGPGSLNLMFPGPGRSQAYRGPAIIPSVVGSKSMFNAIDDGHAGLGTATTPGIGNVIGLISRALGFIGTGELFINGVDRSVAASHALQMLLYVAGSYSGAGTGPFTFGLEPPTAPTLAVTPTASTIMAGTYSTVHWFVRGDTGGRSRRSTPSAVVVNSGFKMRHTVAGADLTYAASVGADRIGIGATAAGFGATGPHYEEREIAISSLTTVDAVANSVELEWADPSLVGKDLAPILDYPPPAAPFAAALEDVVAVIGAYDTAVSVSLPVFIESFPPDSLLTLPAIPRGVLSRAADGFVFIGGEGYVAALLYTGGVNPLSLRVIWPTTGIQNPNNWFLGEGGRLYAATAKRGLVRIDEKGEPDTTFAQDIADDTASWVMANVVGGFDADHNRDCFGYLQKIWAFNPQREKWDTPYDLSTKIIGNLCSCVPVSGGLLLAANDGTTIRLYNFNGGTGMTYTAIGQIHLSPAQSDQLLRVELGVRSDSSNTITVKIFTNGDSTTPSDTRTIRPTSGRQFLRTQKTNVRGARSHQLSISQVCGTGDAGPDVVRVRGVRSNVT